MDRRNTYYNRFRDRAGEYLNDRVRLGELMDSAGQKMEKGKERLKEAYDTVHLFYRLLKAYVKGEYTDIPAQKVLLIIAAFIYLVSPFDAVFDFVPGGLIDDGAIFIWLLSSMKEEMSQFREWEESMLKNGKKE